MPHSLCFRPTVGTLAIASLLIVVDFYSRSVAIPTVGTVIFPVQPLQKPPYNFFFFFSFFPFLIVQPTLAIASLQFVKVVQKVDTRLEMELCSHTLQ